MRHALSLARPEVLSSEQVEALLTSVSAAARAIPGVVLLYLHGSYARGSAGPLSDIDLAVWLEREGARERDAELKVSEALEDATCRDDLDIVILNRAGPMIRERVLREGRLIFARNEADVVAFQELALKEAFDFEVFSRAYDDTLFAQLAEGRFVD